MSLNKADLKLMRRRVLPLCRRRGTVVSLGVPKIAPKRGEREQAKAYFKRLGFDRLICIDAVDWEGCDRIVDLNRPLPKKLIGVADLLIDPGTLEHVFNLPRAFANCVKLLAVGGVVLHHSPLNWIGHGFVNLGQAFFHDGYAANGFDVIETYKQRVKDDEATFWAYQPKVTKIFSARRWLLHTIARKAKNLARFHVPMQRRFELGAWAGHEREG